MPILAKQSESYSALFSDYIGHGTKWTFTICKSITTYFVNMCVCVCVKWLFSVSMCVCFLLPISMSDIQTLCVRLVLTYFNLTLLQAKRVALYLARACPNRLLDELMTELQTVETLNCLIERTETPPFYRLTSMRKASSHSDGNSYSFMMK